MFIENIVVLYFCCIYFNFCCLIVVLEICRYVKRYINVFVKIVLFYWSLNENFIILFKKGDK